MGSGGGSYHNIPKAIVYLLKGDYRFSEIRILFLKEHLGLDVSRSEVGGLGRVRVLRFKGEGLRAVQHGELGNVDP